MDNTKLAAYVSEQARNHIPPKDIKEQLLAVGWTEDDVDAALAEGLVASGVPAPEGKMIGGKKSSVAEIAVNFFSFVLLATVAFALGALYYSIIGRYFPDPLVDQNSYSSYSARNFARTIHYSIAALIIGYPLYYAAVRIWFRRFHADVQKSESKLTKWLTYLVLIVAAGTVVGDLITVLFYFFQGEVSVRFFLKALTILVIGGMIFSFYFLERRKIQYGHAIERKVFTAFGSAVSALVIIGIVLGFMAAGSPDTARKRGFDDQREQDLQNISSAVTSFATRFERLPGSLDELVSAEIGYRVSRTTDPVTGEQYTYRVIAQPQVVGTVREGTYELCTTFSLSSEGVGRYANKYETHDAGKVCFTEIASVK